MLNTILITTLVSSHFFIGTENIEESKPSIRSEIGAVLSHYILKDLNKSDLTSSHLLTNSTIEYAGDGKAGFDLDTWGKGDNTLRIYIENQGTLDMDFKLYHYVDNKENKFRLTSGSLKPGQHWTKTYRRWFDNIGYGYGYYYITVVNSHGDLGSFRLSARTFHQ